MGRSNRENISRVSRFVGSRPPRPARPVSTEVYKYLTQLAEGAAGSVGVVFAVSGGADSLALGVAGADVASRLRIPYRVAIVDHQMRGDSSDEASRVAALLKNVGVTGVKVLKAGATDAERFAKGPEETARNLRHRLLESSASTWGREAGLRRVAILYGHTAEDQAETVLMRLGRGASPKALAGMRPTTTVTKILAEKVELLRGRPLLSLRRSDTEGFCTALGLEWEEDPTNRPDGPWRTVGGTALPRGAVRYEVLPKLSKALDQDVVVGLTRLAELVAEDEDALYHYAQQAYEESVSTTEDLKDRDAERRGPEFSEPELGEPELGGSELREPQSGDTQPSETRVPGSAPAGGGNATEVVRVHAASLARHPRAVRGRVLRLAWTHLPSCKQGGKGACREGKREARDLTKRQVDALDELVMTPISSSRHPVGKTLHLPDFARAKRDRDHLVMWSKCRP